MTGSTESATVGNFAIQLAALQGITLMAWE